MGRLLRLGAASAMGVVAGLALAAVALVGLVLLVVWLTSESPGTRAHNEVQSFFRGRRRGTRLRADRS